MQKLTIENFGPIQKAEININDVLIFIGPQASGKSTISKAIYYFKSLRDDLFRYSLDILKSPLEASHDSPSVAPFAQQAKDKFLSIYGPVQRFPDMYLRYDYGNDVTVEVIQNGEFTEVWFRGAFNRQFKKLIQDVYLHKESIENKRKAKFLSSRESLALEAEERAFSKEISERINAIFNDTRDFLFLPAGRGLVTTMSEQLSNINLSSNLDDLMRTFIRQVNDLKPAFTRDLAGLIAEKQHQMRGKFDAEIPDLARAIIESILRGRYEYNTVAGERLYFEGGYTKINYASSGQQESVWILLLIFSLILNRRQVFVVIEEPEAHLYPIAQKQIIDLLILLANHHDNQLIMTTHSPYILSACNNLIYAYLIGQQKPADVMKITDRHLWLNPDRLGVFMVEAGEVRSIQDQDSGLLETAAIDSASEMILDVFNQLFDLDDAS